MNVSPSFPATLSQNPAGGTIRSTQGRAMEAAPVTEQSSVGAASPQSQFPATLSQEVRVVGTLAGNLLGPEYKIAVGDRYFWVGALTFKMLNSGYSPDELELIEIDPDAPDAEDY